MNVSLVLKLNFKNTQVHKMLEFNLSNNYIENHKRQIKFLNYQHKEIIPDIVNDLNSTIIDVLFYDEGYLGNYMVTNSDGKQSFKKKYTFHISYS